MVRVRVRAFARDGFFRAHRYWPCEPVDDEVDEGTLAILQAEPNLAIEVLGRNAEDDKAPETPVPPIRKVK